MSKPRNKHIRLRGVRIANNSFDNKAWLDNTLLKLEKSFRTKAHTLHGFNWGDDEKGGLQLALAICLELYPPKVVRQVYPFFYKTFLAVIAEDGFDLTFDLTEFDRDFVDEWL